MHVFWQHSCWLFLSFSYINVAFLSLISIDLLSFVLGCVYEVVGLLMPPQI